MIYIFLHQVVLHNSAEIPTRCSFVIEFIIPKVFKGSTCFKRHTAHHQELQTVFAASGLYAHMVTGHCQN
jgi:fatty-acid desaturase